MRRPPPPSYAAVKDARASAREVRAFGYRDFYFLQDDWLFLDVEGDTEMSLDVDHVLMSAVLVWSVFAPETPPRLYAGTELRRVEAFDAYPIAWFLEGFALPAPLRFPEGPLKFDHPETRGFWRLSLCFWRPKWVKL